MDEEMMDELFPNSYNGEYLIGFTMREFKGKKEVKKKSKNMGKR